MKVLHVIPTMAASYGGPRQTVLEFCQQSQGMSVESEICATDSDGDGSLAIERGKPVTYEGVVCHFLPHQFSRSLHYSKPLRQWLDANVARYDLVHINGIFSHATYAAGIACQAQKVPYLVSPHGMLEPWSMAQKRPRKAVAWRFFYRDILQQAAAVVYSTEQERRLTEKLLGLTRGVILPAGVTDDILTLSATNRFRNQMLIPPGERFILALSRLHPKKGLDLLVKVFVKLKQQGHLADWNLVIAGDGAAGYVQQLKAIAHGTAVDKFVHWPGWLKDEMKFAALVEADLFVLSSFQENFGRGVIESMGCCTPVLLSPQVGLAPEIDAARAGWVVSLLPQE